LPSAPSRTTQGGGDRVSSSSATSPEDMSDLLRCPFCQSTIPAEAIYCSRCGGKIPRGSGTAPGIAPRSATPVPEHRGEPAAGAGVAPTAPMSGASGVGTGGGAPSSTSASPGHAAASAASPPVGDSRAAASSLSQSMSISRLQRPAWGLRLVLLLLGAGVCVAGGWALGRGQSQEPIAAVVAPPVVQLGQPRVAVGADLPDPSRFLEPTPSGETVPPGGRPTTPAHPRAGGPTPARPETPARAGANGNTAAGANANAAANANPGGGGQSQPAPGAAGGQPGAANPAAQEPDEPDDPEGQLDTNAVIFVVRHYLPQVRACYERQLRNEPGLHGQITMRFTVGAGGRVTATSVMVNSTGSDALAACVTSTLRTWHFPEPEGGAVAFEYPFRFGSPAAMPELPGATQDP